jgi:phosphopantetheine--protein transferase-like protein
MIPAMLRPWHLGNDIVDLTDPRHSGKARDHRFLRRVYSQREQDEIRSSENPDLALWIRWAAKESAFKTVSKALGAPPTFIHHTFEVSVFHPDAPTGQAGENADPPMTRFGEVHHESLVLPLRIEVHGPALHAVTWASRGPDEVPRFSWGSSLMEEMGASWRSVLRHHFSPREWNCVSHQASALTRLAARKSLSFALGVLEQDLEIGCGTGTPGRRIPKVFLKGRELPADLSLSHHGRLLAWAFLP